MIQLYQPRIQGLPKAFTDPFHEIYTHVTRAIEGHAAHNNGSPSAGWIQEMVQDFALEYKSWETKRDYEFYFKACICPKLDARFLHLTVCAFLHISYDLPVVMAKKWPGIHYPSVSYAQATNVFYALDPIFPDVLLKHGRSRKVIGRYGILAKRIPNFFVNPPNQVLSHWTKNLRATAWTHAQLLAESSSGDLDATKIRMMQAMVTALGELTLWPWSPARLNPPHGAFRYPGIVPLLGVTQEQVTTGVAITAALLSLSSLLYSWWTSRQQVTISEVSNSVFVERFAVRILFYMNIAIRDKERFEREIRPRFFEIKRLLDEQNTKPGKNPE
ncbi:MAG: hypothetical protein JWM68_357 [Verrucomicrobiales bacterium]|nr:hypothetical protein [Verrucomicrobiales bacterium]